MSAVFTSSPPAWTSSAGKLLTPADFLFFSDCTATSTSLQRIGWSSLCLSGHSSVLMDLHWPCHCTAQSSILSIGSVSCHSSVRHFPERSWTVVAFPCFTVVKSFTSWYALLQLFFFRFSSISLHCSRIKFSFAFFMHLLMLLFTCLYLSNTVGFNLFSLLSFCHTDQEFLQ